MDNQNNLVMLKLKEINEKFVKFGILNKNDQKFLLGIDNEIMGNMTNVFPMMMIGTIMSMQEIEGKNTLTAAPFYRNVFAPANNQAASKRIIDIISAVLMQKTINYGMSLEKNRKDKIIIPKGINADKLKVR